MAQEQVGAPREALQRRRKRRVGAHLRRSGRRCARSRLWRDSYGFCEPRQRGAEVLELVVCRVVAYARGGGGGRDLAAPHELCRKGQHCIAAQVGDERCRLVLRGSVQQ